MNSSKWPRGLQKSTQANEPQTNDHAELLGTLLNFPHLFKDYRAQLAGGMFYELEWLFDLMCEADEQEGLTYRGVINRAETAQITAIKDARSLGYSERRVEPLVKSLKKAQLAFELRVIANEVLKAIFDDTDPDEVVREMQQRAFELFTTDTGQIQDMGKHVEAYAERMLAIHADPAKAYGLMVGISELDRITTGWHKGDLSVIGARTSMGKSAFMLENVLKLNSLGFKCAVFSLEMSRSQMYDRMMANLMQVNFKQYKFGLLTKHHYDNMLKRKHELTTIYIDDARAIDADYITDTMRRLKRTQGLDFAVVDYLQDVKEKGETSDNQGSALGRVCRKLRKAAQENECHVMGISQVARAAEHQQNKRPGNSDLSGSAGIESAADVIALLYRDDYYNPNTDKPNILEVNFTKQRNGEVGMVELHYDRTTQRITSLNR